ncbi:hypothetical protein BKA70DRAFT_739204 [Coprinopsis sp. MPI-PUGE-AT-0042]|nr:hypothetical protein BKA70DRAFT_739204 [Coprinopsis sp. MPI-PUGE-AT-0042]
MLAEEDARQDLLKIRGSWRIRVTRLTFQASLAYRIPITVQVPGMWALFLISISAGRLTVPLGCMTCFGLCWSMSPHSFMATRLCLCRYFDRRQPSTSLISSHSHDFPVVIPFPHLCSQHPVSTPLLSLAGWRLSMLGCLDHAKSQIA